MKDKIVRILNKLKNVVKVLKKFVENTVHFIFWFRFVLIFLFVAIIAPRLIWRTSFEQYLEFIKILIWPVASIVLFKHFKEALTYLFFSLRKFNLFGLNGDLRNIEDVIEDEVLKNLKQNEQSETQKKELKTLQNEILRKTNEIITATGNAEEFRQLAIEALQSAQKGRELANKSISVNNETIYKLAKVKNENKQLRNQLNASRLNYEPLTEAQKTRQNMEFKKMLEKK